MANTAIKLELCAPERDPVHLEVSEAVIPGEDGIFSVLPDHTPFLTTIIPGVFIAYGLDSQTHYYAVNTGLAEVIDNRVAVLTETLESHDEIDKPRAEAAHKRAEDRLQKTDKYTDVARAEASLGRARARIQAHGREGY